MDDFKCVVQKEAPSAAQALLTPANIYVNCSFESQNRPGQHYADL